MSPRVRPELIVRACATCRSRLPQDTPEARPDAHGWAAGCGMLGGRGDHVRIGLQIPDFSGAGGAHQLGRRLAEVARTADDAGFDSLAVMDHFFQISMV